MVGLRLIVVASVAFAARMSFAAPAILIVQQTTPERYGKTFDVQVGPQLAQEFDDDGRVVTITWSMADPVFRAAVDDKLVSNPAANPKLSDALDLAVKLHVNYVLIVKAVKDKGQVDGEAKLYKSGKIVWQNKRLFGVVTGNAADMDATAASIARTWVMTLCEQEFKGLPTHRRTTPDMDPGKTTNVTLPTQPPIVDDKQLIADAAALAKAGQNAQLFVMLRSAVDVAPFDPARRRVLIDYLNSTGQAVAAADEAQRASIAIPESADFHVLSARAYMLSGDTAKAQAELNEAVARDPESYETRLLLGELSLSKLDAKDALVNLDKAVAKNATTEALYKRALANSLAGNVAAAQKDLAQVRAAPVEPTAVEPRYAFAMSVLDADTAKIGADYSKLIQRARVKADDPSVVADLAGGSQAVAAMLAIADVPTCPDRHKKSHEIRVLALNLLAQCVAQIEAGVKDKDADALTEATISLGEALKQFGSAKVAYRNEMQSPAG